MNAETGENLSLETLPKELLLVICNYLNTKEVKNLGLSCKSFNHFIGQNVSTLKKLRLQLNIDSSLTQGKKDLTRNYAHVNIKYVTFSKNIGLWLSSNFCSFLRILKITNMDFSIGKDKKLLRKTFQALQHLETLLMRECDIDDSKISEQDSIEPVEIKSLKSVELLTTHLAFLLFLRTPNLTSLKIANKSDLESPSIIINFLAEQPLEKLENLALWTIDFEHFEDIDKEQLAKIKIPLRNLSMHFVTNPFQTDENFLCFLNLFAENLTELDFRKIKPEPPKNVYEVLFTKFHKVKTLRVALGYAPDDADFYSKLPNNPAVTKLIIFEDKKMFHTKALYGILTKLPNIETLIIKADIKDREILQFIATNCTNLKALAVNKIVAPEQTLKGIKMPNLESLSVCSMKYLSAQGWKNVIRSFNNLQSLSIHKSDQETLNDLTFNIFTKSLGKLKHLMFGEGFKAIKRVFNQMKNNCKHLQTVEILKSAFEDKGLYDRVLNDFKKEGLRFICYDETLNFCDTFDQSFGTNFWKTSVEQDEEDYVDSDYTDSDTDDDEDSDFFNQFSDDDVDGDDLRLMLRMLNPHGPGGVPWYDSDSGEQQMGRFDSDGEWEPWEAEYYLD